jgi:hypothetical protein
MDAAACVWKAWHEKIDVSCGYNVCK